MVIIKFWVLLFLLLLHPEIQRFREASSFFDEISRVVATTIPAGFGKHSLHR